MLDQLLYFVNRCGSLVQSDGPSSIDMERRRSPHAPASRTNVAMDRRITDVRSLVM